MYGLQFLLNQKFLSEEGSYAKKNAVKIYMFFTPCNTSFAREYFEFRSVIASDAIIKRLTFYL